MGGDPPQGKKFPRIITVLEGGVLPLATELLEELGIKGGDYVHLQAHDGQIELRKVAVKVAARKPSPYAQTQTGYRPPEAYPQGIAGK